MPGYDHSRDVAGAGDLNGDGIDDLIIGGNTTCFRVPALSLAKTFFTCHVTVSSWMFIVRPISLFDRLRASRSSPLLRRQRHGAGYQLRFGFAGIRRRRRGPPRLGRRGPGRCARQDASDPTAERGMRVVKHPRQAADLRELDRLLRQAGGILAALVEDERPKAKRFDVR